MFTARTPAKFLLLLLVLFSLQFSSGDHAEGYLWLLGQVSAGWEFLKHGGPYQGGIWSVSMGVMSGQTIIRPCTFRNETEGEVVDHEACFFAVYTATASLIWAVMRGQPTGKWLLI